MFGVVVKMASIVSNGLVISHFAQLVVLLLSERELDQKVQTDAMKTCTEYIGKGRDAMGSMGEIVLTEMRKRLSPRIDSYDPI